MQVDRELRKLTQYTILQDKGGNDLAQIRVRMNPEGPFVPVASVAVPCVRGDIEGTQRCIYTVARAFLRMMKIL